MRCVLICGAGKIGSLIACLLLESRDYNVHIADVEFNGYDISRIAKHPDLHCHEVDVQDAKAMQTLIAKHHIQAIISSLPFFVNTIVAQLARDNDVHYFDLTEDTKVTEAVSTLAKDAASVFMPQCGLAPGFISIVANSLMDDFDSLVSAKLRVGALPQHVSNALQYALTWSTEGVINEYANPGFAIAERQMQITQPLEGLETIKLDGLNYEAFNTSGGLGSLAESYQGNIDTLNYKTLRYPGHCEKMRVLLHDLKLNQDRQTLKAILERAIPKTYQDVVIVYVSIEGFQHGEYTEAHFVKKYYPQTIHDLTWSAIQVTTAASCCVVADIILKSPELYHGLVRQEQISLNDFLQNQFAKYYQV